MATPRWTTTTCFGYLLFFSTAFFSEARFPPPSGANPDPDFKSSSSIEQRNSVTVNGDGIKEGVVPSFIGIPGLENHVTMPDFGNDGSNGYDRTQPGTSRLVCTPVNCPTPSGLCGVIYINLEAQTSSHGDGDQNKGHIAMAPSEY